MKTAENILIGERLKSARMQLGFSRREFADVCGVSAATLQAWEDGRYAVPKSSIVKYVEALLHCGLVATFEWFVRGEGFSPRPQGSQTGKITSQTEAVLKEMDFFEKENEDSVLIEITDDAMLPFYTEGDIVGGRCVPVEQIAEHVGTICIVTISSGETFVRKLRVGSQDQCFHLLGTNLDTHVSSAFLPNCKVVRLAPVIWHRRNK